MRNKTTILGMAALIVVCIGYSYFLHYEYKTHPNWNPEAASNEPAQSAAGSNPSVAPSNGTTATVQWSEGYNGATARAANQVVTLPGTIGTGQSGNCFVLGEVSYTYAPLQVFIPLSTITLSGSIFLTPRQSASIKCSDCATPN